MEIINNAEIDAFLWEHRENGCKAGSVGLIDGQGLHLNTSWFDRVTGEEIKIKYDCDHMRLFEKAESLWCMLDDISTAGDIFKPNLDDPFVKYVLNKCEERSRHFISDGYDLFVTQA